MGGALLLHRARQRVRPLVPARLRRVAKRTVFSAVGLALTGHDVVCPCCGRSYRRFVSYPTAYCPGCGAYERQRLLSLYLDRNPELIRGDVLQIGPEACVMNRYRSQARSWLAVDLDPAHPLADRTMDVAELQLSDDCMDLVLCSHVLDVVERHDQAVRELFRVTRPGGTTIVQAPRFSVSAVPDEYVTRLAMPGFDVRQMRLPEQDDPELRGRFGLARWDPLYICRR
jgi:SAM-dependent methyltransferase